MIQKTRALPILLAVVLWVSGFTVYGAQDSQHQIYLNNEPLDLTAIEVEGVPYVPLPNVAELLDMDLSYYEETGELFLIPGLTFQGLRLLTERPVIQDREYYMPLAEYLISHGTEIKPGSENLLGEDDSGLDAYNLILIGEAHAIEKTYEVELELIKYLNQTQGIRMLTMEIGFCDAGLINLYFESGDTHYLDIIYNNLDGTYNYSQNSYQFIQALYALNQTLPEDQKLIFFGSDLQHQGATGIHYLSLILPDAPPPSAIAGPITTLANVKTGGSYNDDALEVLLKNMSTHTDLYQQYLGDRYETFAMGLQSILDMLACAANTEQYNSLRETYMIQYFIHHFESYGRQRCIGIFGSAHTELSAHESHEYIKLGTYLNHSYPPLAGKIANIPISYTNSYHMDRYDRTSPGEPVEVNLFIEITAESTPYDLTFFRLDQENSSFVEKGITDFFQYMIHIKNSPPAKMYTPLDS